METQTGAGRESFPETSWSSILSCLDPNAPERRARLREIVIDRISDYVNSRDGLMDELRELFSG